MESIAGVESVRVFLVGLSEGLARSLVRYIGDQPHVTLTGAAPSLALANMLLPATRTDLAMLDWSALGPSSKAAVEQLRRGCPGLRIIGVMNDEVESYRLTASQIGVDAMISSEDIAGQFESLLHEFFPQRFTA
jgi:DNA-binding NarL/FixJ family response regulator